MFFGLTTAAIGLLVLLSSPPLPPDAVVHRHRRRPWIRSPRRTAAHRRSMIR
jgi:hypothetical protein